MIFARTNTYGIDTQIYNIQSTLQSKLSWFTANGGNVASDQVLIYGRIYRNDSQEGVVPENYLDKKDYADKLNLDQTAAQIAFNIVSRTTSPGLNTANIEVIFTVNTFEIYDNESYETERTLLDAMKALGNYKSRLSGDVKEGNTDVFSGFYLGDRRFSDMSPFYVFSIPLQIRYVSDLCKDRQAEGTTFTADNNTITVDNNTITVHSLLL